MKTPIRVALCEDNENFRESLHQFIADRPGFEVCFSNSSAENILEQISKYSPDVILMDIDMPELTGIQATGMVKSIFPQIDVLILTVYDDDERIFEAILAGASGYLL